MGITNINCVRDALSELVNLPCWGIIAGKGSGSVVSLYFGEILPRKCPLKNPTLSDKIRNNESQYSVMLWSAWQLYNRDHLLCEWTDSNLEDDFYKIFKLEGKKMIKFEVNDERIIKLNFSESYMLKVSASSINDNSISVFTPDHSITLTGNSGN